MAMKRITAARNLPSTTSQSRIGAVISNSRLPVRCSSESRRMVSAGPISSSSTVTVPNRSCSEAVLA